MCRGCTETIEGDGVRIFILFITLFIYSPVVFSQEAPVLSGDAFITLAGDWNGEYIFQHNDGTFDTSDVQIDVKILPIARGIAAAFIMTSGDGNLKEDNDTILISEDGRGLDMGNLWMINEIVVDQGDTILMLDRKESSGDFEVHYLRSILRAGPDMFAILTAVKRNEGEDYILEEQYRFKRKK